MQQHALTGHHRLLDASNRSHRYGGLAECIDGLPEAHHYEEVIILLHGLGRSGRSMRSMGDALRKAGHTVAELDYPSTRRPIAAHAGQVREVIEALDVDSVSFVTHSLGGIIARTILARGDLSVRARRLVMCAPPSRGASLARVLHERVTGVFGAVMGPVGAELAGVLTLPAPEVPSLVVAGSSGRAAGYNPLIEGDDDGIVAVSETKLEGAEHQVVESIHTLVMNHPDAQAAAVRFLSVS